VSPDFDNRLRDIAERDGKLLVEVLEEALEAYERWRARQTTQ
jgi:predicted transcriptional regulator